MGTYNQAAFAKQIKMKQILPVITLIFSINFCFSQEPFPKNDEGKIEYSEVIKVDSTKNDEQLFKTAKEFFSTNLQNFQRSNSEKNFQGANIWLGTPKRNSEQVDALFRNDKPITLSEKEDKKLVARIVNKYTGGTMGCIRILYFEYDIILRFKDGRYKYQATNFRYTHYNQASMKQSQIYGMKDSGDCNSKNSLENLLNCQRCKKEFQKMFQYLNIDTNKLLAEMKEYIKISDSEDDNW